MENQRLALQLETAQAGGIRTHASPTSPPGLHFPGCGSPPGQEEEGGAMAAGSAAVVRPLLFSVDQLVLLGELLSYAALGRGGARGGSSGAGLHMVQGGAGQQLYDPATGTLGARPAIVYAEGGQVGGSSELVPRYPSI